MMEIEPPWVKYPGYGPGDGFWRQSGEAWFAHVWEPFWNALNQEQQEEYLKHWNVPEKWKQFYFDKSFMKWLESTDD